MSGHSKWSQIKRQKAVTDQKRGALFTKLGLAVTQAARDGGGDINTNFKLRLAVDSAKSANMPKDNIDRAIKRGTGELGGGELLELTYEAVVAGVGLVINTLTDNKNRTAAEIKHTLSKHNASLSGPGSVSWQFKEFGVIRLSPPFQGGDKEGVGLKAIDLGAQDVTEEAGLLVIKTDKQDLQQVKEGLEKQGCTIEHAELELVPDSYADIDNKARDQLMRLLENLDENPDVSDYYYNVKI